MRTANLHTLCIDDAIAPLLDLFTRRHLTTTTTTTTVDYMLVFVFQKILSLSGLLGQNILLLCCYAERQKDYGKPTLCSVSSSTVCIRRASFMHMLRLFFSVFGDFQAPPIGWNINYSVLRRLQWIHLDANVLEMRFSLVRVDKA